MEYHSSTFFIYSCDSSIFLLCSMTFTCRLSLFHWLCLFARFGGLLFLFAFRSRQRCTACPSHHNHRHRCPSSPYGNNFTLRVDPLAFEAWPWTPRGGPDAPCPPPAPRPLPHIPTTGPDHRSQPQVPTADPSLKSKPQSPATGPRRKCWPPNPATYSK